MLEMLVLLVFPGLVVLAATMDMFTMTIPNKLCLALVAAFFVAVPFAGLTLHDVALHAACALGVLTLTFILFASGVFGGGDAKFSAGVALWLGPTMTLEFMITAAIFGGLLTTVLVLMRSFPTYTAAIQSQWAARLLSSEVGVPYGIALSGAAMVSLTNSFWFASAIAL